MKSFKFTYCFTDEKGVFEPQENGQIIFTKIIRANYNTEALDKLSKEAKGKGLIDVIDFEEVEV